MTNDLILSSIPIKDLEHLIEAVVNKAFLSQHSIQPKNDLYISIRTAALLLGVSHVTIYEYIKECKITKYKINRTTRLLKSEVLSMLTPE